MNDGTGIMINTRLTWNDGKRIQVEQFILRGTLASEDKQETDGDIDISEVSLQVCQREARPSHVEA